MKKKFTMFLFGFLGYMGFAQSNTMASGSTILNSQGSISFSIGQVVYTEISGAAGSANQGVQQPYEIYELEKSDPISVKFDATIYPNPTAGDLIIKLVADNPKDFSYVLFDLQGRMLLEGKISSLETSLSLERFPTATYILKVLATDTSFKNFKIVKKHL